MKYLIDTNVAVAVIRNKTPVVRERLRNAFLEGHPITISTVSTYELWYGVAKSSRPEETARLLQTFLAGNIEVQTFEASAAATAGSIRATLESTGQTIGPYDILIAGHAISLGATLVTANTSEFARVQGLTCEDWSI